MSPAPTLDLDGPSIAVACGFNTCCAAQNKVVRCWGGNFDGLLGIGGADTVTVGDEEDEMPPAPIDTNVLLPTSELVVQLSACRVSTGGPVQCWGHNGAGKLGTGDAISVRGGPGDYPVLLQVRSDTADLAMGLQHLCTLSTTGEVRCLGTGFAGANGEGSGEDIGDEAGEVPPAPLALPAAAQLIGSGGYATCAWLENREMWCWGENTDGQLGVGNTFAIGDNEMVSAGAPVPLFQRP